jgi:hypothetical protein
MKPLIDPEALNLVFLYCLFSKEEINDGIPENAVKVEGIVRSFGFHPDRLEKQRETVKDWLLTLPQEFRKEVAGGWSFLNACQDKNGSQWTDLHVRMDELFCIGMGLNLVRLLLPREMWKVLPGGMPYYVVLL